MIVHFAGSRYKMTMPRHANRLRLMVNTIQDNGHTLVENWVEADMHCGEWQENVRPTYNWSSIYESILASLNKADVVIADSTVRSFSVGFQVAMAMQMKKPTLVLRQEGTADSLFAGGIEEGVIYKTYRPETIEAVIKGFLDENDIQSKDMRFNFFIDRKIYNYLRWASFKTGKTKAKILRELVEQEIEKREPNAHL